jgi:hypothetical protein
MKPVQPVVQAGNREQIRVKSNGTLHGITLKGPLGTQFLNAANNQEQEKRNIIMKAWNK